MKREYKFSSILMIVIINSLTIFLIYGVFAQLTLQNQFINLVVNLLLSILGFVFNFTIASGLIRNRMGSVSDYLNQINYINSRLILVAFIISMINSILYFLIQISGGITIALALLNPNNESVFAIGSILIPVIMVIFIIVLSALFAYTSFYLADEYDKDEGIFESIKNILIVGKNLLVKTIKINMIYMFIPTIILLIVFIFLFSSLDMATAIFSSVILGLIWVIYAICASVVVTARLSDAYLDYKNVIEA